jgi:hypothetical protein
LWRAGSIIARRIDIMLAKPAKASRGSARVWYGGGRTAQLDDAPSTRKAVISAMKTRRAPSG